MYRGLNTSSNKFRGSYHNTNYIQSNSKSPLFCRLSCSNNLHLYLKYCSDILFGRRLFISFGCIKPVYDEC